MWTQTRLVSIAVLLLLPATVLGQSDWEGPEAFPAPAGWGFTKEVSPHLWNLGHVDTTDWTLTVTDMRFDRVIAPSGEVLADVRISSSFGGTTGTVLTAYAPGISLVRKSPDSLDTEGIWVSPDPSTWSVGTDVTYSRFRYWTGDWAIKRAEYNPYDGHHDAYYTVNGTGWMVGYARASKYRVVSDLND